MKRLLAVLFAVAVALPVAADTQVVCSISAQAETACSAITVSQAGQLDPCRCNQNAPAPAGPFGGHATLADGLVSYWPLGEESGVRADSIGSNDLTDNNTVGYVNLGPQGTVASFVTANTESLSVDPGPTPTVVSISAWVNCSSSSAGDQYGQVFSLKDGLLFLATGKQDSGNLFFAVEEYSSAWYGTMTAKGWTASSTYNTWNHLLAEISDDAHTITLYLNGALWVGPIAYSNSWGTGVAATKGVIGPKGMVYTGSVIGPSTAGFNPKIARTGVWSRVLTAEERTSLYNSGLGKSYSDLTTAEKVGLVSYWNLDEASGNRADSHGSNTLTDNNTVTSVDNTHPGFGKAASFVAASAESLSAADDNSLDLTGDYTISAWVKLDDLDNYRGIISKHTFSTANSYDMHSVPASGTLRGYHGTGENNGGPPTLVAGVWAHVMKHYSAGTVTHYIDTVQANAIAGQSNLAASSGKLYVGALNWAADAPLYFMNGKMAHVAIWSRALTAQERTDLYNSGAGLFYED